MGALQPWLPWILTLAGGGLCIASFVQGDRILRDRDLPPERGLDGSFLLRRRRYRWWLLINVSCAALPLAAIQLGLGEGTRAILTLLALPVLANAARIGHVGPWPRIGVGDQGITLLVRKKATPIAWGDIISVSTGLKPQAITLLDPAELPFVITPRRGTKIRIPSGMPGRNELLEEIRKRVPSSALDASMRPIMEHATRQSALRARSERAAIPERGS